MVTSLSDVLGRFAPAVVVLMVVASHGCAHDPAAPIVAAPVRDAIGDADLRMMIAEIAAEKACDRIRDRFHPLRAPERHDVVTGVLWFRTCVSTHDGTNVTFTLTGSGWQWVDKTKHEAGAKFLVHQYVRFAAKATISGVLDLGYDRATHIATLWFSPSRAPVVDLDPIGGVAVDRSGAWSSLVATVASAFARSPSREGAKEAKREGTQSFMAQLAEGLTVTIDLCTGVARSEVGHIPKGQLAPPGVLEPSTTEFELEPGGVLMLGPNRAQDGMTVQVDAPAQISVALVCVDDAEAVARAYLDGTTPAALTTLAETHDGGATALTVPAQRCPVAVVARSLATSGPPLQFTVQRSSTEIGWSNGGPAASCGR
jgi:hypothetical protein